MPRKIKNTDPKSSKLCNSCASSIPKAADKCVECGSFQDFRRFFSTSEFFFAQLISLISVCTLLVTTVSGINIWPNYELTFTRIGHNGPYLLVVVNNHSDKKAVIIDASIDISYKTEVLRENAEPFLASVPLDVIDGDIANTIMPGATVKKMAVQGFDSSGAEIKKEVLSRNVGYFFSMLFDRADKIEDAIKPTIEKQRRDLIIKGVEGIRKAIICNEDSNDTPIKMKKIDELIEPNFTMGINIRFVDSNGEIKKQLIPINSLGMQWWFGNYKIVKNLQNLRLAEFRKTECMLGT